MRDYVTYKRKKISDNFYADPNTNNGVEVQTGGKIKLIETSFNVDGTYISYIEYDGRMSDAQIEYFRTLDPDFDFKIVSEEDVNILLSSLGDIKAINFEFIDNRPIVDIISNI